MPAMESYAGMNDLKYHLSTFECNALELSLMKQYAKLYHYRREQELRYG